MDGGRRRRIRAAAHEQTNAGRMRWYSTYRSVRFRRHYLGDPVPDLAAMRALLVRCQILADHHLSVPPDQRSSPAFRPPACVDATVPGIRDRYATGPSSSGDPARP
jgi:hypothetical protein